MTPPSNWAEWNPLYVHRRLIPKMKAAGVAEEQIKAMLVENPRRLFEEA
jgi:phosphotriesterase-related protein